MLFQVMHLKQNVASSPPPQATTRKVLPKVVEPMQAPPPPTTDGPVFTSESLDNGNNQDGEGIHHQGLLRTGFSRFE